MAVVRNSAEGKYQSARSLAEKRAAQADVVHQGLCKSPNSAGKVGYLRYDLVPGRPDESILIYRLESTAPKVSMPALGRDVVHEEGVELLRQWIGSLSGTCRHAHGDQGNGATISPPS
jgi:hypothetical protein